MNLQKKFLMQFYLEKFKVEIFKKYSLSDAKKAHEELEARKINWSCSNYS